MSGGDRPHTHRSPWWIAAAVGLVALAAFGLRMGTDAASLAPTWDEPYIKRPIDDIIRDGWSIGTMIDFQETKGPALIWLYAAFGEVAGGDIGTLRLLSVILLVLSVVPLALLAQRCGIDGPQLLAMATLYALLPYNLVLGQLMMSESSFIFGASWLALAFVWGFGSSSAHEKRVAGPVIFGLILVILLYNRVHAVALAAAAAIVAFDRDRWKSWPWWTAIALAGLSRVPLWIHWGGLVSSDFQDRFGLGLRLESLTYLAAAMAPFTAVLLWPALTGAARRGGRWWIAAGAVLGLVLGLAAQPSLELTHDVRYQGIVATLVLAVGKTTIAQHALMTILAMIGTASLMALMVVAHKSPLNSPLAIVSRLTAWTLLAGWCMYALTYGYVFDRYLVIWAMLLPIVWIAVLPPWLLALQALGLAAIAARLINVWLLH